MKQPKEELDSTLRTEYALVLRHFNELRQIDCLANKTQLAIQELIAACDYAAMSADHAFETAEQIREMLLPDGCDPDEDGRDETSHSDYARKVFDILDNLALQLGTTIRQNSAEEFIYRGLLSTESILSRHRND